MTPKARSMEHLRKCGYRVGDVERRVTIQAETEGDDKPDTITIDLFGVADLLACHAGRKDMLLVQCTTASHVGDHITKVKSRPGSLRDWLRAGGRFEVWGWYQGDGRWQVKRVELHSDELEGNVIEERRRKTPTRHVQKELF